MSSPATWPRSAARSRRCAASCGEVESQLAALQAAPGRIRSVDVADRLALERDIHDGVQQRLTALRIRLGIAADEFSAWGNADAGAAFATFGDQVAEAIDELRAIAHGIYPPLLASDGLATALADACRRASSPVSVVTTGTGRYSPEIELAVYFTAPAAIDNTEKHARPGPVTVALSHTGDRLRFSISDEGPGFDPARVAAGGGLTNMRARLAAVGGSLEVESHPAHGTRVAGTVPLGQAAA